MEARGMRDTRNIDGAQMELEGTMTKLGPALDGLGLKAIVEPHADARIHTKDRMGRSMTSVVCRINPDWRVIIIEPKDGNGMADDVFDLLRRAGAAVPDNVFNPSFVYYEGHILSCCDFSRNLTDLLEKSHG